MARLPLLIGAALMLAATGTLAQEAPGGAPPPPPPGGPALMMHPHMMDGEGGHGGWMAMHEHRMAMMQKAAAFRFRRGDSEIDIKCADDESTKACVDAAATLIDKINAAVSH